MTQDRDLRPEEIERVLRAACRLLDQPVGTIEEMTEKLAGCAFAATENWVETDPDVPRERAEEQGDLFYLLALVLDAAGRR